MIKQSITQNYVNVLRNYVTFTGRAARSEFWLFVLMNFFVTSFVSFLASIVYLPVLLSIYSIAVFLPFLALSARRLHDTDRSAWWILIFLLPLIGFIVLLVFFIQKGSKKENRFGKPNILNKPLNKKRKNGIDVDLKSFLKIFLSWWILVPIIAIRPIAILISHLLDVFFLYFSLYYPKEGTNVSLIVQSFRDYGESSWNWGWLVFSALVGFVFFQGYQWLLVQKTMKFSSGVMDFKNGKSWLPNQMADFKTILMLVFKYIGVFIISMMVYVGIFVLFALPIVLLSVLYFIPFIKPVVIFAQVFLGICAFVGAFLTLLLYNQAAVYYFLKTWQIRSFLRFGEISSLIKRQFKPLLIIVGVMFFLGQVWGVVGQIIIEVFPMYLWLFVGSVLFVGACVASSVVQGKCFFWLEEKENAVLKKTKRVKKS